MADRVFFGGGVQQVERNQGQGSSNQIGRVRYLTQVKSRPPTFAVFVSGTTEYPENSKKFVSNSIRERYGFQGVPIRILVRHRQSKKSNKLRKPRTWTAPPRNENEMLRNAPLENRL